MNDVISLQNILSDILDEYAKGEILSETLDKSRQNYNEELNNIKVGYGINDKNNKIKQYAAYSIKINYKTQSKGARRYDWDSITYKDREGNLLNYIADYILSSDDGDKMNSVVKIIKKIEENLILYFEEEFSEKVDEHKNYYQQYGSFEYTEV